MNDTQFKTFAALVYDGQLALLAAINADKAANPKAWGL